MIRHFDPTSLCGIHSVDPSLSTPPTLGSAMILNPRKNSAITFPRVFRGFGQENSTEANAHTARTAMPPVERHFFRERISSISGMLQNVAAKSKASRPDSTPNFDDLGASYYYSTRPSIDSLNLHAFQLDCEGKKERERAHASCFLLFIAEVVRQGCLERLFRKVVQEGCSGRLFEKKNVSTKKPFHRATFQGRSSG